MIFETIILSLFIGKIKGGKIQNLEKLYIEGWPLIVIAFLIKLLSLLLVSRTSNKLSNILIDYFQYIHILIYLLLIIGLALNWKLLGFKVMFLGSILNMLAIIFNNGKMPVSINALIASGQYNQINLLKRGRIMTHILADESTKLICLGDIIPLAKAYISPKVISVGDILIAAGIFILIQRAIKVEN